MRCRKGDWVAEENSNFEVDHDVIGRFVVFPDSEVMSGFASQDSPASDFSLLTRSARVFFVVRSDLSPN